MKTVTREKKAYIEPFKTLIRMEEVAENEVEAAKLGFYRRSYFKEQHEIPFHALFKYMFEHYFRVMYVPSVGDMLYEQPLLKDDNELAGTFIQKMEESVLELSTNPKFLREVNPSITHNPTPTSEGKEEKK